MQHSSHPIQIYRKKYHRPAKVRAKILAVDALSLPTTSKPNFTKKISFYVLLSLGISSLGMAANQATSTTKTLEIPASIQIDHRKIHGHLVAAQRFGGATAGAAKRLEKILEAHAEKVERYALPLLSILPVLSRGEMPRQTVEAQQLTTKLRTEESQILQERKEISSALGQLRTAAKREGREDVAAFCDDLSLHVKFEEEILYPAALLVGDYIRLKQLYTASSVKAIAN